MPRHIAEVLQHLQHADGVLVTVETVEGSGPREKGAWMVVFADALAVSYTHLTLPTTSRV